VYKLQFFLHLFTITFDDLERLCQRILTFMGILSRKWQSFSGIYVYHLIGLVTCSTYCKNRENIRMIFLYGGWYGKLAISDRFTVIFPIRFNTVIQLLYTTYKSDQSFRLATSVMTACGWPWKVISAHIDFSRFNISETVAFPQKHRVHVRPTTEYDAITTPCKHALWSLCAELS